MGCARNEVKALPLHWFSGLAILSELVESTGVWPQGLLDAYIAMIPKADGDSTPLGQRPPCACILLIGCGPLFGLVTFGTGWKGGCISQSFSLGDGLSSVKAWFSTALDIEEVLSGVGGDQLMSSRLSTRLTGLFLIVHLGGRVT